MIAKRAKGRTLEEFGELSKAEQLLLEKTEVGEVAFVGFELPEQKTDDNRLNPDFVRFLLLGGDEKAPVHEHGVRLQGGWIDGDLDLGFLEAAHPLSLWNCQIDGDLIMRSARLRHVQLDGSSVRRLEGDEVVIQNSLF